ncbi:MAG: DNA-binding response regulator [bacterium]|nr:DNA-binding response regulator [bacterium]
MKHKRLDIRNSVLVVDEEPEICKTLKKLFEKKWYEVSYVTTGKEAIKKIKKRKFNIALLDVNLPDIEGTKLIPILKKVHPGIKIVMMAGDATKENTISALNNGASYYFEKPFNIEKLLTKTDELIEEQRGSSFQRILEESARLGMVDTGMPLPFKIRKAIEYIEENYMDPDLCLGDIALAVGMHPNSFSSVWNKSKKTNIKDFINDIRIAKAKRLLVKTTRYTFQIASKVGLSSSNFGRVFKAKTGFAPTRYRERKYVRE